MLTLTVAEALDDTSALAMIIDPYTITISDTAADLQALSATQIASLSSAGVTLLEATDQDVAFTTTQEQALGAADRARAALQRRHSGGDQL